MVELPPVTLRGGSIHLPRELCDAHLAGAEAVAVIERDGALLVVPLVPGSAGGLLLKLRNARGDRVIAAQEFLRTHGYADSDEERRVAVRWDESAAALMLTGIARDRPAS